MDIIDDIGVGAAVSDLEWPDGGRRGEGVEPGLAYQGFVRAVARDSALG